MSSALVARAARQSLGQIRYVSPVPPRAAGGLVAAVYAQAERDFGMLAPPLALHSPAPAVLAAAWLMLRETLLVGGPVSRVEKETVAAAVSAVNTCPYCVSVHTAAARAAGRGRPGLEPGAPGEYRPGFTEVAVTFHYLNRMVNVFLPGSPLPPRAPKVAAAAFGRLLGSVMLSADVAPGHALRLLPAAPLPAEFGWAAGDPLLAEALAKAAAAIGHAGERAVPRAVRELVLDRLDGWDGQPPGPSRAWVDMAAGRLAPADRPAGRLALLTALASYQVGPADIDALRPATDEALIGLTAWASMAATRRIAARLGDPAGQPAPPSAQCAGG